MRPLDIIRLANSNLWRNKSRTVLTILAIFIGALTIMLTTGINTGVNDYIDKQVNSVGAEDYLQIMPKEMADQMTELMSGGSYGVKEYSATTNTQTSTITNEDIDKINQLDGVKNAKPYKIISTDYVTTGVNGAKKYDFTASILPTDSIQLDLAAGRNVNVHSDQAEMVLPDKFLNVLGFNTADEAIGKKMIVGTTETATKRIGETEITIVGVQNQSVVGFGSAWVNDKAGEQIEDIIMAGLPDSYRDQTYSVVAQIEDNYLNDDGLEKIKDELEELGYTGMTLDDSISMIKTFFNAITTVLTIFGVVALVAASIGIINTLFMAVQERTREIGLMKAMGLSRGKIFTMFSMEAVALGFWGGVMAVIVAYIIRSIVNPFATETFLSGLPGFTLVQFNPVYMVIIVLVVMAIAFLAGTFPARRAAGKDPIEALRYE